MAGTTIRELGQSFRIIGKSRSVTVQTPTHVHDLGVLGDGDLRHIPVAGLTIQSRRNVGPVCEMDKVGHLCNRHPGNFLIVQNVIF